MSGALAIRIASRGSRLALWQADAVRQTLVRTHPGLAIQIDVIRTTGDKVLDVPLARIGDRGLFTKELDLALLEGDADLAVHSLKDVPTRLPAGLRIAAISERADPRDVVILRDPGLDGIEQLPAGARVGTSSLRRRAQLGNLRPDIAVLDLRGNLDTRLAKLDAGEYDAVILAAAGVIRLGWGDRISQFLGIGQWLPAVGQGALAIVAREDRSDLSRLLESTHHGDTAACVTAERAFLASLEGGCQVPIGALATLAGGRLELHGLVADLDGEVILRDSEVGTSNDGALIGTTLAGKLIDRGAGEILDTVRRASTAPGITPP